MTDSTPVSVVPAAIPFDVTTTSVATTATSADPTATPVAGRAIPATPTAVAPSSGVSGGWQVWPGQVTAFADAVHGVRAQLTAVFNQVDQLTAPDYQAQLGSSPVGQGLTEKFTDRLSGDGGLLNYLNTALTNLDAFVSQAEQTAANYRQADADSADGLRAI
jgi:hypothetical protein